MAAAAWRASASRTAVPRQCRWICSSKNDLRVNGTNFVAEGQGGGRKEGTGLTVTAAAHSAALWRSAAVAASSTAGINAASSRARRRRYAVMALGPPEGTRGAVAPASSVLVGIRSAVCEVVVLSGSWASRCDMRPWLAQTEVSCGAASDTETVVVGGCGQWASATRRAGGREGM